MASSPRGMEVLLEGLTSFSSQGLQLIDLQEHFHVLQELGAGGYGSVLLGTHRETNQRMALKMMHKNRTSERRFLQEFSISFFLSSHPNIIGSFGMAFMTPEHYVFGQEVAPLGDLFSLIIPHVGLAEDRVKRCARQISRALEFIAETGLVHMDIKPENVLILEPDCWCVKVSDFGLARVQGAVIRHKTGSDSYMAPEMCALTPGGELAVAPTLDVWAFGVLLYCLMTGEIPWKAAMPTDKGFSRFVAWQHNIHSDHPPGSWDRLPTSLQRMLRSLLAIEANRRSKSTEILRYMEESWRIEPPDTTDTNSPTRSPDSCSQYTSFISHHPTSNKDLLTPMSCHFTTEGSGYQCEGLPVQWQDDGSSPIMLLDEQISMFVGAEVEIT